jgi:3-deoxy-D-manno-octulosonic-acid transferase
LGGQNLIEACACGKPVLFGPHMFNFAQISEAALEAGAACQLTDAAQVFRQVAELLSSKEVLGQMADAAIGFAERDKGATQRTVALLKSILN